MELYSYTRREELDLGQAELRQRPPDLGQLGDEGSEEMNKDIRVDVESDGTSKPWIKMPRPLLILKKSDYLLQVVDTKSHT